MQCKVIADPSHEYMRHGGDNQGRGISVILFSYQLHASTLYKLIEEIYSFTVIIHSATTLEFTKFIRKISLCYIGILQCYPLLVSDIFFWQGLRVASPGYAWLYRLTKRIDATANPDYCGMRGNVRNLALLMHRLVRNATPLNNIFMTLYPSRAYFPGKELRITR